MFDGSVDVSISAASDTFLSNPVDGQTLTYQNGKWRNLTTGATALTAIKNTSASSNLTLTSGVSAVITKFIATLSADRVITLAGTTPNAYFELSFVECVFNAHSVTVSDGTFSHVFNYPTYLKYVYISGNWERVL